MKIGKKANQKAIKACQKLTSRKLSLNTSWEECFNIMTDAHKAEISVATDADYSKGLTHITLHRGDDSKVFDVPSAEYYDRKEVDWNWNNIYKLVCEELMKAKVRKAKKLTLRQVNSSIRFADELPLKSRKEVLRVREVFDTTPIEKEVAETEALLGGRLNKQKRGIAERKLACAKALLDAYRQKNEFLKLM